MADVTATSSSTAICGWAELLPGGYGTVARHSTGEGARSIRGPPHYMTAPRLVEIGKTALFDLAKLSGG